MPAENSSFGAGAGDWGEGVPRSAGGGEDSADGAGDVDMSSESTSLDGAGDGAKRLSSFGGAAGSVAFSEDGGDGVEGAASETDVEGVD